MNKLFYEVDATAFKATKFMVMGKNNLGNLLPMRFNGSTGSFIWAYPSENPEYSDEAAELYDMETALLLLGHHAINSGSKTTPMLFPFYTGFEVNQQSVTDNPYLNAQASKEGIKQLIRDSAAFCRDGNSDEWNESWSMPKSLGGEEVVPAIDSVKGMVIRCTKCSYITELSPAYTNVVICHNCKNPLPVWLVKEAEINQDELNGASGLSTRNTYGNLPGQYQP